MSFISVFFWGGARRNFTTAVFLVVVVAPHVVALCQTGEHERRLASPSDCCQIGSSALEFVQPADSVHQTRSPDPQKEKMVIFCHLRGGERKRVGFIPSPCVRALS